MECAVQCDTCGTCLVDGFRDGAAMECPRCGRQYGGGD